MFFCDFNNTSNAPQPTGFIIIASNNSFKNNSKSKICWLFYLLFSGKKSARISCHYKCKRYGVKTEKMIPFKENNCQ